MSDYTTVEEILWAIWGLPANGKIRFKDAETGEYRKGELVYVKDSNDLGCLFG